MKIIIQRVNNAHVYVSSECISSIGYGYLLYVCIEKSDSFDLVKTMAHKVLNLRIMKDTQDKMNNSILQNGGEICVVSQFTLCADTTGRRPGFSRAASPQVAQELLEIFCKEIKSAGIACKQGEFGAMMTVTSENDGPVTIIL